MFQWLPPRVWRNLQAWSSSRLRRPCMVWLQPCDTPLFPAHRHPLLCSWHPGLHVLYHKPDTILFRPRFLLLWQITQCVPFMGVLLKCCLSLSEELPYLFPPPFWFSLAYNQSVSERSSQLTLQHIFPVCLLFIFHSRMKLLRGGGLCSLRWPSTRKNAGTGKALSITEWIEKSPRV